MTVMDEWHPLDGQPLAGRLPGIGENPAEYRGQEPSGHGAPMNLEEMAAFVVELRRRIARIPQNPYPVLGAEGDTFVIEIAAGPLRERDILSNLIIEIKGGRSRPQGNRAIFPLDSRIG